MTLQMHVEYECPDCCRVGPNVLPEFEVGYATDDTFMCSGCGRIAPLTDCGFELR